jgi:hypothetical protein
MNQERKDWMFKGEDLEGDIAQKPKVIGKN